MAEKKSGKQGTQKRRVKNPETFRERALKASEEEAKPKKAARLRQAGTRAAKPIAAPFRPVGRGLHRLFRFKPFVLLGKLFVLIGKILLPQYIRNSWRELRLVNWPSWKESRRLTFAVLAFAVVFGLAIAGVDWVLNKAFKEILLK